MIWLPLFATNVIDTSGKTPAVPVENLAPVWLILVTNLPPVSLIPVVRLNLRISPKFSKKFEMTQNLFLGAWGKIAHEKT